MQIWTFSGILLLGEYKNYTSEQMGGILIGIALCILGVKALTMKYSGKKEYAEEDAKMEKED